MNRVETYAEDLRKRIKSGDVPQPEACVPGGTAETAAEIDLQDHAYYQDTQSQAFASEKISYEEAQTCYGALGAAWSEKNGGWAKSADLAMKISVTNMVAELRGASR